MIERALASLYADKTVIAIAHRLSTIRGADKILVLDAGTVVEAGNHESLWLCTGATQNYSARRTHRGCPNHHDPDRHQSARRRCATVAANACVPKEPLGQQCATQSWRPSSQQLYRSPRLLHTVHWSCPGCRATRATSRSIKMSEVGLALS